MAAAPVTTMQPPLPRAGRALATRITTVVSVAVVCLALMWEAASATDATIGLYSDANGYSCSFNGNNAGFVTAYVVIRPGANGIRGVRFSAPIPSCFDAVFLSETAPDVFASIGSSQTGISISSRNCEMEPFYALQITYLQNAGTTPCCAFPILADQLTGALEAVDCSYNATPIQSVISRFNADASCPCGDLYQPPLAPSNPYPANGASAVELVPQLLWATPADPGGLALSYDVYFGTVPSPPLVASNVLVTGPTSYNPGPLFENTVYFWRIVLRNAAGKETAGGLWSFTTRTNLPPTITYISPAYGAVVSPSPTLQWIATDPDGGALYFDVYLGPGDPPPLVAAHISAMTYSPPVLQFDTTYRWRIVVHDHEGQDTSGPTWTFTTRGDPPPVVTNLTPACGTAQVPLPQTLTWQATEPYGQSMTYDVYFGAASAPPLVVTNLTLKSYTPVSLAYSTTYFWRVVAHDSGGQQASTEVCSFTTKAENEAPSVPSSPSPADNATGVNTGTTFSWQSTDPEGEEVRFDVFLGKIPAPTPNATIGVYTDAVGSSCSLSGNPSGLRTLYVVVKPRGQGISGVRFSAVAPGCFGSTYLYDVVPAPFVSIGSSQTGISIASPTCLGQPFVALQMGYMANASTTPCCEFTVAADPFTGHVEAVDCAFADAPITPITSYFNANNTCKCDGQMTQIAFSIKQKSTFYGSMDPGSYYQWQVIARDPGLHQTAGPLWTFQTRPNQPPAAPSSPSPANGAVNVTTNSTLSWQASDPELQQLKFDVYFGAINPPPLVASNVSTKSFNPGALANVTTYWWRVVARDTYAATTSGPAWSFTTKPANLPPAAPIVVSPANGATNLPVNTKLVWTASDPEGQALKYDVYFGTETAPPMVAHDATVAEYVPLTLAVSTTYRWRIVARDTGGLETSGATSSFQTSNSANQAPTAAGNPSPPDGAFVQNKNPLLEWYAVDPDNDPLTYLVFLGPVSNPYQFYGQTTERKFQVGPLEAGVTYYWHVELSDGHWYITSPVWSFYLAGGSIPVLISRFDAKPQRNRVDVTWELSSDEEMDKFTLQRRDENGAAHTISEGPVTEKGSFVDTGVQPGLTYHYELVVRSTNGNEIRSIVATVSMPDLELTLHQNQPNPFNPQTTIRYDLPTQGGATRVRLMIVDATGRRVRTLVDETQSGGTRSVVWNGRDDSGSTVSSGVYFYVLDAGKERLTRKLVLLK